MAYTSFERSINARKQLRDRYGKWIYQGGSVKWFDLGTGSWKSGTVDSFTGDYVNISIKGSGSAKVHRSSIENIPKKASLDGGESYTEADFDAAPEGSTALVPSPKQIGTGKQHTMKVTKNADGKWAHKFEDGSSTNSAVTSKILADKKAVIETEADVPTEGPKDIADWTAGKAMGGSNGAQLYTAPDGEEYVVKFPQTADHANNEVLASRLYDAAGIPTPSQELVIKDGKIGVASPLVPGASSGFQDRLNDKDFIEKIQKGFAVDAWLSNWDVTGLTYDNIISDENDDPIRIDPGGALRFRAQGAPKGDKFGDKADEWETLTTAPEAGQIFGPMTDEQKQQSATLLTEITDEDIDRIVDSVDFSPEISDELKSKLKNRRNDILERAGASAPAEQEEQPQEPDPEVANQFKTTSEIDENSEYGKFLIEEGIEFDETVPQETNNKWFKEKFGKPMDAGMNPGWLPKDTVKYDLQPGDIVFGYMQSGPLLGMGKQKFVVSGSKTGEGENLLNHLPKKGQEDSSPGTVYSSGEKNDPTVSLKISSAIRPPQTSAPKEKEEKKVTVLTKDLPSIYLPKKGDWVSDTEGAGYFGTAQKWHIVLEDEPTKTNLQGNPVYMVSNANGPQNYAPDVYGMNPDSIKAIQVTQERLDEIKNTPNSEQELEAPTPQVADQEKSWFSPATDPGEDGDGYHASGPWGKYGAAGVMIQDQETGRFLLVQRGPMVSSNKGKWQLPGGAINSNESPAEGAARETIEELKAPQNYLDTLEHKGDIVFDNGQGWQYTNITATSPTKFSPEIDGTETGDADWFSIGELKGMKEDGELHPAFAEKLDDLFKKFESDENTSDVVTMPEEQVEDLAEGTENQETLDQIKDNFGIPKKTFKTKEELDELPAGTKINAYNTMFQMDNILTKHKDGKWWADSFGPMPEDGDNSMLQDSEDLLIDGFAVGLVENQEAPRDNLPTQEVNFDNVNNVLTDHFNNAAGVDTFKKFTLPGLGHILADSNTDDMSKYGRVYNTDNEEIGTIAASEIGKAEFPEKLENMFFGGEANDPGTQPRVSTGPADLNALPEGAVIQFSDADADKHYTKNSEGTFDASWLPEGHEHKKVTTDQVHAVASFLGQDVQVTNENENKAPTPTPEPEVKEMEEVITLDDELSPAEMDMIDSLEESVAGTQVKANDANDHQFEKGPNGFWFDIESEVGGYTPHEIVSEYGADITIVPRDETTPESSELRQANIEDLYDALGIDPSQGNQAGIEQHLETGDKLVYSIFNSDYTVTKQDDKSWLEEASGTVLFYPGEVDAYDPKNVVSIITGGVQYNNNDNSDSTSAITTSPQADTTHTGEVVNTINGINIDGDGNQWVPDKNGVPIYNGSVVTNKKGILGKVTFIQKGGKKVRVDTPDGDTKFWNNHMVERTDDAFVLDTPKYQIQVNGDGKEYVTNDNADMIFVGDTVTSPGKAGFTGVVQGFKSNGQFVLILDPADNKVKPRKTDKITVEESASSAETPTPPAPEEVEEPLADWEKELLNGPTVAPIVDGETATIDQIVHAPAGAILHAPGESDTYFKKAENLLTWELHNTENGDKIVTTQSNFAMESTILYSQGEYVWGPPSETPAQEEENTDRTVYSWEELENLPIGTTINIKAPWQTQGDKYQKTDDDEWYGVLYSGELDLSKYSTAGLPFEENEVSVVPPQGGEIDPDFVVPVGDKVNAADIAKAPIGSALRKDTQGGKYQFIKVNNNTWKRYDKDNAEVTNSDLTWNDKEWVSMAEYGQLVWDSPVAGPTASAPEESTSNNFKVGDKITDISQLDLVPTGEKITHNNASIYTKKANGTFTTPEWETDMPQSAFKNTIKNGTLTYGDTTGNTTPASHGLSAGDKVQTGEQLKQMIPGEFVKSTSALTGVEYSYVKQEDGTFKNPQNGSVYDSQELEIGLPGNLVYGGDNYQDPYTEEKPSELAVGEKVTSVNQMDEMVPGDYVYVKMTYANTTIKYVKQSDGEFQTEDEYTSKFKTSMFNNVIDEGTVTYGGRQPVEFTPQPEAPVTPATPQTPVTPTPTVDVPSLPGKDGKKISVGATVNHPVKQTGGVVSKIDLANGDVWFKDPDGKTRKYKAKFLNVTQEAPATTTPTAAGTASNGSYVSDPDPNSPWYGKPAPQSPQDMEGLDKNFAVDGLYDEIAAGYQESKGKDFSTSTYKNLFDQLSKNGSLNIPGNFTKNEEKYGEQKDLLDFFQKRGYLSEETAKKAREHFNSIKEKNAGIEKNHADLMDQYNKDLYEWKIANGIPLSSFNPKTFVPSPDAQYILDKRGSADFGSNAAADKALPGELTQKDKNALTTWYQSNNKSHPGDPDYVPSISWSDLSQKLRMAGAAGANDLSSLDDDQKKVAQALDDATERTELVEELVIVRGGAFKNFVLPNGVQASTFEDLKNSVGNILVDYGYFAASPQNNPGYASNHQLDIIVRMPKGSHAAWLGGKNEINPGEAEILLPRGSRFYVRGVKNENGSGWGNHPQLIVDLVPEGWEPGMPSILDSAPVAPEGAPGEGGDGAPGGVPDGTAPAAGGPAAGGGGPAV